MYLKYLYCFEGGFLFLLCPYDISHMITLINKWDKLFPLPLLLQEIVLIY